MTPLSEKEYRLFKDLIYAEAGIALGDSRQALVQGRLSRRLRDLELPSFAAYYSVVLVDPEERTLMMDRICTNETNFFREPQHFKYLEDQFVPMLRKADGRPRLVRVWSAACSTGEEPYSLAMVLCDLLPASEGWDVRVLATDLSTRVLAHAKRAIWPMERSANIPKRYLQRFMTKGIGSQTGFFRASPELRERVTFAQVNLNGATLSVGGPFDAIFCRNVLIYFDQATRYSVIDRMISRLSPNGHLFLGHAESIHGRTDQLRCVAPTLYVRLSGRDR